MARQLTPLGVGVVMVFKWVAIPLLLAFVGLKLIGPNIGSPAGPSKNANVPAKRNATESAQGKKFQSVREGNNN